MMHTQHTHSINYSGPEQSLLPYEFVFRSNRVTRQPQRASWARDSS